jgi:hypothetical protein
MAPMTIPDAPPRINAARTRARRGAFPCRQCAQLLMKIKGSGAGR